jgi:hypothetical protein
MTESRAETGPCLWLSMTTSTRLRENGACSTPQLRQWLPVQVLLRWGHCPPLSLARGWLSFFLGCLLADFGWEGRLGATQPGKVWEGSYCTSQP